MLIRSPLRIVSNIVNVRGRSLRETLGGTMEAKSKCSSVVNAVSVALRAKRYLGQSGPFKSLVIKNPDSQHHSNPIFTCFDPRWPPSVRESDGKGGSDGGKKKMKAVTVGWKHTTIRGISVMCGFFIVGFSSTHITHRIPRIPPGDSPCMCRGIAQIALILGSLRGVCVPDRRIPC